MSDSEFHYVRTSGVDAGVDAVDGRAIGVDLETILKDGLPPFKVALEIIASLCEILDISDQDGEAHGDVGPESIFLDDTGAVSVEGFGMDRRETRAPEGEPDGPITDLYGLGYTAYRLLATRDLTGLPSDPDGHDDAVIDAVIALPWGDMPEEWVGDIQWFLAKLMSFDPEERPTAVDAWRTFIAFADEAEGESLVDWSPDAIEGGGARRDAAMAVRPAAEESEDLGGPVVSQGALKKGAISFGGGAKSGQATAFWSKDQMKAALEAEEEEEEAPAFKPSVGGGAATSFWTRDQMEAMARGDDSAPRPKRKEGGANRRKPPPPAAAPPPATPSPASELQGVSTPASPPPVAPPPVAPPPAAAAPPPVAAAPMGTPPVVAAAAAGPAIAAAPQAAHNAMDDEDEGGGGGGMKFAVIGVVVALLLLLCVGGGGIAAVVGVMYSSAATSSSSSSDDSSDASASSDEDADDDDDADEGKTPAEDTGDAEEEDPKPTESAKPEPPKADPKPTPKPPATTTRRSTNRGSTRSSGGSNRTASKPAGPTRVTFTVPGAGSIKCGDGTNKDADGKAYVTFRTVPADGITCTFVRDGKPVCAGFVEPGNRKCACNEGAGEIACN